MQKKYESKGVALLALSNEPAAKVKPYVKKHGMKYIVASGSQATNKAYGVKGFPTMFIVDPDGKIAWRGHPASPEFEKSLIRILKEKPPKKGGALAGRAAKAAYKKANKLYKKKKYAKALKGFEKVASDFKGTKAAKHARAKIKKIRSNKKIMAAIGSDEAKKQCNRWLQMARGLARNGKDDEAIRYYQRIVHDYPDTKYAETASREMASL